MAVAQRTKSRIGLLLLAYVAFIALGMPDGLLGVAWPTIRRDFGLPLDFLGIQIFAGTTGYLISTFLSGKILARLGVGRLLAASCLLTGAALLGFSLAPAWWVMLALSVFTGLGAGAIDAGLNTYIASEHNEGLMQWLHASYGVGITMGPIIMTAGLSAFNTWRWGYTVVALVQLTLGVAFAITAKHWKRAAAPAHGAEQDRRLLDYQTSLRETVRQPRVWLSALLFFLYVGSEVSFGLWAYTLLTEARGVDPQVAGLWTGSYWAAFTLGRILAGLYTQKVSIDKLLRGSMLAALAGAILLWLNPFPWASLAGVAIVGFAFAPIFPGLISTTSARVAPKFAANTIGIQISMGGVAGAAIPGLAGVIAAKTSLEAIPLYLVILVATMLVLYVLAMHQTPESAQKPAR